MTPLNVLHTTVDSTLVGQPMYVIGILFDFRITVAIPNKFSKVFYLEICLALRHSLSQVVEFQINLVKTTLKSITLCQMAPVFIVSSLASIFIKLVVPSIKSLMLY